MSIPSDLVIRAMSVAREMHRGQMRESSVGLIPFFEHPCDVAAMLSSVEAGLLFGPHVYAVAFLHDVLEDTSYPADALHETFGSVVYNAVERLTCRSRGDDKTHEQVAVMRSDFTSDLVRAVKIADKTVNLIDLVKLDPDWAPARKTRFVSRAKLVVEAAFESARDREKLLKLRERFYGALAVIEAA